MANISDRNPINSPTSNHIATPNDVDQSGTAPAMLGKLQNVAEKISDFTAEIFNDYPDKNEFDDDDIFGDMDFDIIPTSAIESDHEIEATHLIGSKFIAPTPVDAEEELFESTIFQGSENITNNENQIQLESEYPPDQIQKSSVNKIPDLRGIIKNPDDFTLIVPGMGKTVKLLDSRALIRSLSKNPEKFRDKEIAIFDKSNGALFASASLAKKLADKNTILKNHKYSNTPLPPQLNIKSIQIISSSALDEFRQTVINRFKELDQQQKESQSQNRPVSERKISHLEEKDFDIHTRSKNTDSKARFIFQENAKDRILKEEEASLANYNYQMKEQQKDEAHDTKLREITKSEYNKYLLRRKFTKTSKLKVVKRIKQAVIREIKLEARADALERKQVNQSGKIKDQFGQSL